MWKDIKGYEGNYQVNTKGQIKNLQKDNVLIGYTNNRGYQMVHLRKGNTNKLCSIHRIVATAFIPNPLNLPEVNHKDENKTNNCVDNLEWCTRKYNTNYGTHNKRISDTKRNNTYNTKPVQCVETKIIYPSVREAERQTKIDNSQISAVCNKKKRV